MGRRAVYDEIADWYEREFLARDAPAGGDPLGIKAALDTLLGPGSGGRDHTPRGEPPPGRSRLGSAGWSRSS